MTSAAAHPFDYFNILTRSPNRNTNMDAEKLKDRYYGSLAQTYDSLRENTPLWTREQEIVRETLRQLDPGSTVVDAPVGTGRFLPLYREFGLRPTGVDASREMLDHAAAKGRGLGVPFTIVHSDLRSMSIPDKSFDMAVCIRFLNWVDAENLQAALRELTRVTRHAVVFGVRSYRPLTELDFTSINSWKTHFLQLKDGSIKCTRDAFLYHEPRRSELFLREMGSWSRNTRSNQESGFDYPSTWRIEAELLSTVVSKQGCG
jgi:ubiquinone/menaquinone biosynthesis C-methylase UbiE